jgi:hypothetical protein
MKRLKLHTRLCRFEFLEARQVLSATLTSEALAALAGMQASVQVKGTKNHASVGVVGLTPFQIQSAYGLYTGTQADFGNQYDVHGKLIKAGQFNNNVKLAGGIIGDGKGQTIAIIDSGNSPTIVSDTNAFSKQFGLPQLNATGGPTLKVVNQNGSSNPLTLPFDDPDASVETALDVQWVHSIAPNANILLVEVNDPFAPNSGGAVDIASMLQGNLYARSVPGVTVISNSWGGGESLGEQAFDYVFSTPPGHAGITFVFSAGDSGGPASYPAASPNVVAVGGTSLKLTIANKYSSEKVWNDASSGNGAGGGGQSGQLFQDPSGRIFLSPFYELVPSFQKGLELSGRGTPDISWNADPLTGFAVYDSFAFGTATPWEVIGGTSAGAPAISALLSIADQGRKFVGKNSLANAQSILYSLPRSDFHDIISGNNDYAGLGLGLSGNAAAPGYDLASGLGTPIANLFVRDLVANNGTSFVSAPGAAGNSPGRSSFLAHFKPRVFDLTGIAGGADAGAGAVSIVDAGLGAVQIDQPAFSDVALAAVEPLADTELPGSEAAANASDSSSPFASHGKHWHHGSASADEFFSQLDDSLAS